MIPSYGFTISLSRLAFYNVQPDELCSLFSKTTFTIFKVSKPCLNTKFISTKFFIRSLPPTQHIIETSNVG